MTRSGAFWARRSTATAASTKTLALVTILVAPAVATHRLPAQAPRPKATMVEDAGLESLFLTQHTHATISIGSEVVDRATP